MAVWLRRPDFECCGCRGVQESRLVQVCFCALGEELWWWVGVCEGGGEWGLFRVCHFEWLFCFLVFCREESLLSFFYLFFFFFSSRVVLKIWAVVGLDINRRLWYSVCTGQLVVPILKPVPVRRSSLPVILSCRVYFFSLVKIQSRIMEDEKK